MPGPRRPVCLARPSSSSPCRNIAPSVVTARTIRPGIAPSSKTGRYTRCSPRGHENLRLCIGNHDRGHASAEPLQYGSPWMPTRRELSRSFGRELLSCPPPQGRGILLCPVHDRVSSSFQCSFATLPDVSNRCPEHTPAGCTDRTARRAQGTARRLRTQPRVPLSGLRGHPRNGGSRRSPLLV